MHIQDIMYEILICSISVERRRENRQKGPLNIGYTSKIIIYLPQLTPKVYICTYHTVTTHHSLRGVVPRIYDHNPSGGQVHGIHNNIIRCI